MTTLAERAQRYDREHARSLRALAYRMLGSRAEAEDIVQEAWLRWAEVDESTVEHPRRDVKVSIATFSSPSRIQIQESP